jgi:alkylhydroperoxidase family enzyme
LIEALRAAALEGPGELTPELRRAAASGAPLPLDLETWVEMVRERAYATTDADVEALRRAGHSEDAIFEVTVAAALGAGLARFEAGVRALR